jgi:gluconolactonase
VTTNRTIRPAAASNRAVVLATGSGLLAALLVIASCGGSGTGDGGDTPNEPTATVVQSTTTEPTIAASASAATDDPLAGRGEVELIDEGYGWTEGPQWLPDKGVLLFTDSSGTIFQLADDQVSVFRRPSGGANGLALDPQRRLIAAENSRRRVTRTDVNGTVSPIADQFQGLPLNQPNDIAVRSDGTIYFTDPYYGEGSTDLDFHGIFRIAPDGSLTAERRGDIAEQPNGIALSPDESQLYVANWADDTVWVFDVADDGSLSEPRTFVTTTDGPDGLAVDDAGNLFVATPQGIEVFAPDGTRWGEIPVPATNCAFGGADRRTLYITQPERLYRVTLANPGPY